MAVEADLLAVVASELVVAVAEPVRVTRRRRVEQDAGGVHRRGGDHDRARPDVALGAAAALEVLHARGPALGVGRHPRRDRARDDLQPPGLDGGQQEIVGGVEVGGGPAAGAARAAVVAGAASVVRPGQDGAANGHARDAEALGRAGQDHLRAAGPDRRQVIAAAGQRIRVVVAAGDADELLDAVVVRGDVRVADRPRDVPAVPLRAGEVEVRHPQADAAPDVRLAAPAPGAVEVERPSCGRQVGLLARVEPELLRPVALLQPAVRLERQHVRPRQAAVELPAGVEHQHAHAVLDQGVCRHRAGRAAADDDDVVRLAALQDFHDATGRPRAGCPG